MLQLHNSVQLSPRRHAACFEDCPRIGRVSPPHGRAQRSAALEAATRRQGGGRALAGATHRCHAPLPPPQQCRLPLCEAAHRAARLDGAGSGSAVIEVDHVDHHFVRRVELFVLRRAHFQPLHVCGIVARVQGQHPAQLGRAVEMHRHRLHPRVVRVARVVDVAAVHLVPVCLGEEPAGEVLEALALALGHVARLLFKLAPQRHRD
mmetsp:Transcript_37405/g.121669  ORF Transcript_37405/g.121669 Transcript_37405/m.121669 type:complete len:206 (+) Transcript_37405:82-699(+)